MATTDYLKTLQSLYRVQLGRSVDSQELQATAQALNTVGAPSNLTGLLNAYRTNADIKLIIDNQGTGSVIEKLLASFTAALGNVFENLGLGTLFAGLVPKAAQIGTPTASTVTEDTAVTTAGNLQVSGTIAITDPNPNQSAFQTTVTPAEGNLGQLVLAANGSYTYAVANSAVQFLNAGQTQVDTFTVRSVDGTAKQVSFTIQGADEPFIPPTSPQIFTPATGSTSGAADASTALLLDARYILVGDDEGNALRVFDRAGGVAVRNFLWRVPRHRQQRAGPGRLDPDRQHAVLHRLARQQQGRRRPEQPRVDLLGHGNGHRHRHRPRLHRQVQRAGGRAGGLGQRQRPRQGRQFLRLCRQHGGGSPERNAGHRHRGPDRLGRRQRAVDRLPLPGHRRRRAEPGADRAGDQHRRGAGRHRAPVFGARSSWTSAGAASAASTRTPTASTSSSRAPPATPPQT